ncbi:class I SAM-dependent methyltransferase [Paenibacillus sp. TH7-28]
MREQQDNKSYWNEFYKQCSITQNSTFFEFVLPSVTPYPIVVDIGCGSGQDSRAFAENGKQVYAIDASEEAIQLNKDKNSHSNLEFKNIDISDQHNFQQCINHINLNRGQSNLLIYSRFFLHAISEDIENILLRVLHENLSSNDLIALEFRTLEDSNLDKTYNNHYRRYIDTDLFNEKIKSYASFSLEYFHKSRGLSIYKNEDPYLARYFIRIK